jgi:hypothetical protein
MNETQMKALPFFKKEVMNVNELNDLTEDFFTNDKNVENKDIENINSYFKNLSEKNELTVLDKKIIEKLNML